MDFVVVGLGVGALAVLLGLTIREAGTRWWSLPEDQALPAAEIERRLMIGRAGRAGGLVFCLAGGAIILLTGLALGLGLSDRAGAIVVMATIALAVLGGVGWGLVYAQRHHPRPVSRAASRRRRAGGPRPEAAPMAVPSLAATIDAAGMVDSDDVDDRELADALVMVEDDDAAADEVALAGSDPEPTVGSVPEPLEPVLGPPLPVSEVEAASGEPPHLPAEGEMAAGEPAAEELAATNAGDQTEADPAPDAAEGPPGPGPDDPAITPLADPESGPMRDPGYVTSGQERRR